MSEFDLMNATLKMTEKSMGTPSNVSNQANRLYDLMRRLEKCGEDIINTIAEDRQKVVELEERMNRMVKAPDSEEPFFS